MKLGLHFKFTLLMVTLAVVPVALVGYGLVAINQRGVQASVLELHTKLAQKTAESLERDLESTGSKVAFIAQILRRNLPFDDKKELLRSFVEGDPDLSAVAVVDPKGAEFLRVVGAGAGRPERLMSHLDDPDYEAAIKTGRSAMSLTGGPDPAAVFY